MPSLVLTVTPNPAVDQSFVVERAELGVQQRVPESYLDPAGKGINVARIARRLGVPALSMGFLAGQIGRLLETCLQAEGVLESFTWVPGETRLSVNLFERELQRGTSFVDRGPTVSQEDVERLYRSFQDNLGLAGVVVLAGSLPPGAPPDFYTRLAEKAHARNIPCILDSSRGSLLDSLAARPALIKPNKEEAAEVLGRDLDTLDHVLEAAHELLAMGPEAVVVSMGGEGAVAVTNQGAWRATPPDVELKSTVGSGDSMVAGFALCLARGEGIEAGLRLGSAAGAATAGTPGAELGTRAEIEALLPQVRIERLA